MKNWAIDVINLVTENWAGATQFWILDCTEIAMTHTVAICKSVAEIGLIYLLSPALEINLFHQLHHFPFSPTGCTCIPHNPYSVPTVFPPCITELRI